MRLRLRRAGRAGRGRQEGQGEAANTYGTPSGATNTGEVGKEWSSYIEKQLQAEEVRRSSIVARGGAAVASAAGLVTLVLAVFAVFLGKDFQTSGPVEIALGTAVIALLISAVCGVVIVTPWRYGRATISTLQGMTTDNAWKVPDAEARKSTAISNIKFIEQIRSGSNTLAVWLTLAGYVQVIAVAALAAATVLVLAFPNSEIQQAKNAFKDQPGMTTFLDSVEAEGLLRSGEDVVKFGSFYRLSCDALKDSVAQSPDDMKKRLTDDLNMTVSVDQVKALEPARAELCAAQR